MKLIVRDSYSGNTREYELKNELTRIGRAADRNDIVLDDAQVSREHAQIRRVRDSYLIVDLNSANGTYIDGKRVKERALASGDTITISRYTLQLKEQEAQVSIKYDLNQPVGGTVVLKKPGDVSAEIPKIDRSSISTSAADQQSVINYIEVLTKKAETLSRIYELNRMLGSDFDQDAIFKKVSEMVFRLTHAERFFVLLKDEAGELKTVAAEFRNASAAQSGEEITLSKTVVDRVLEERVSLLSFDTASDERFVKAQSIILQNIRSVMCAPLLGKTDVLGAIYVDSREATKILREDDLELLNAVAAETSIAIDNAISHKLLVREELARAKYRRFMPPHVVDEILANPNTLNLGGTNSMLTLLFSDIRNFTSMSESLSPETVVKILNEYFSVMTPIVFDNQGILDKYMGDGMMALFGVPYQSENAAADAVAAAIAMQRKMGAVNEGLRAMGLSEIAIGIGINTGMVTVGYIGSEERTDYTAIGDAVNLAARLEKQAQAGQIIISRSTYEALGDRYPVRQCDEIMVKGKREPVQIYEVLWTHVRNTAF
ncbi:MAG TPA: adenylate/guanylate cyclase domain-containing protein [Blastocatellia bacterium]|nr:adenylate/guanylate cyclase domain-containing protein [Blastocatellia bacterium]